MFRLEPGGGGNGMSSENFESREEDFRALCDSLRRKLNEQIPRCTGETKKKVIRDVERGLEEGNLMIQEMEDEMKSAPSPYRSQMLGRLRGYRRDLEQLSKNTRGVSGDVGNFAPNTSGFAAANDFETMAESQRGRLLAGSESINRASESIARSHRIAAETDQIGEDIIDELGTQRESLVRTRDRLVETDSNLSKSRKILNTMGRRVMTNKIILIVIMFLELCILVGVVYWKFFS